MNFQQLRYVREAVRNNLNLTEASQTLNTSQSGVSKQIRELEIELGIEIFVRKGKRLTGLTRAGEGAVKLIDRVLVEAENLRKLASEFSRESSGRLVIATTHNQARYALPDVVMKFVAEFPDVQLVPAWIDNVQRVMPKGEVVPVPILCTVTFGAPMKLEPSEDKRGFLDRARSAVIGLRPRVS